MKVEGSCYCAKIAFEAEVDPSKTSICYCTDCQQLSGTAFRVSANAPGDRFKITRGTPKEFVKVAASGSRRIQAFCEDCGTALYATAVEGDRSYNIRVGTLNQRAELTPIKQIWCDSALPWLPRIEVESWGRQDG
jgi:hypothetical protein